MYRKDSTTNLLSYCNSVEYGPEKEKSLILFELLSLTFIVSDGNEGNVKETILKFKFTHKPTYWLKMICIKNIVLSKRYDADSANFIPIITEAYTNRKLFEVIINPHTHTRIFNTKKIQYK